MEKDNRTPEAKAAAIKQAEAEQAKLDAAKAEQAKLDAEIIASTVMVVLSDDAPFSSVYTPDGAHVTRGVPARIGREWFKSNAKEYSMVEAE